MKHEIEIIDDPKTSKKRETRKGQRCFAATGDNDNLQDAEYSVISASIASDSKGSNTPRKVTGKRGIKDWLNPKNETRKKQRRLEQDLKQDLSPINLISSDEDEPLISDPPLSLKSPTTSSNVSKLLTLEHLRPPANHPQPKLKNLPQPSIPLPTPSLISSHLPCSLIPSPLDPALACALYLSLLKEENNKEGGWKTHEWYLNGKKVSATHTSAFYRLKEDEGGAKAGGEYWYAGKKEPEPDTFPTLLKKAIQIINPYINSILNPDSPSDSEWSTQTRIQEPWRNHIWGGTQGPKRFAMEYGGDWRANVAAVNCYSGGESGVGWHADQLTYLGPYPTIVSLSLGTPRTFKLRPIPHPSNATLDVFGRPLRTYEVILPHNSLLIMHASCQELYKHTVPSLSKNRSLDLFRPSYGAEGDFISNKEDRQKRNERINITFRFYRPDFHPLGEGGRKGTPNCRCGIPAVLQADQKGKVRSNMGTTRSDPGQGIDPAEETVFFYRCQSTALTGEVKGCGFFQLLDCTAEGKGPLVRDG